jgi:DNA polymerase III subunit delta'
VSFARLVGHDAAVARLRSAAAGRLPHAFLLVGPAGIGKRTLADAFAARLLCAAPVEDDGCGTCAQCARIAAGSHPDLHVVTRPADRRDVRVEQVRELSRWLSLQPLMAARKVAIVDDAHCLNEHGQNALLKTLEEPPASAVLVLCAASAALMLPTVRSRCQMVRLDPLPADAVARVLVAHGLTPAQARDLTPLADGSPGRGLLLQGEEPARARDRVLAALPKLATLTAAELSALAQEVTKGSLDAALATTVAWYQDVLHAGLDPDGPLRNQDVAAAVRAAAGQSPPVRLLRQLDVVCDTIDALEKNANRVLAVETMLLRLRALEEAGATR